MARAIVRTYSGEPVPVVVIAAEAAGVEVQRDGFEMTITVCKDEVYAYSEESLALLDEAFGAGDPKRLAEVWARIPIFG